ncbi:MAG: hypothetical protein LBQ31_05695 [Bacteroidales bacterium]|jgi:CCR4-NOT transcriptional regulation complex NOT5 subunit|nr:hypothetical protein [Bacteroidales bacterium]
MRAKKNLPPNSMVATKVTSQTTSETISIRQEDIAKIKKDFEKATALFQIEALQTINNSQSASQNKLANKLEHIRVRSGGHHK